VRPAARGRRDGAARTFTSAERGAAIMISDVLGVQPVAPGYRTFRLGSSSTARTGR
jgi:hypothetical protein